MSTSPLSKVVLSRKQALVLAREVLDGKPKSFVEAARLFAEMVVAESAEVDRLNAAVQNLVRQSDDDELPADGTS